MIDPRTYDVPLPKASAFDMAIAATIWMLVGVAIGWAVWA